VTTFSKDAFEFRKARIIYDNKRARLGVMGRLRDLTVREWLAW
jgi:hypothetical protein